MSKFGLDVATSLTQVSQNKFLRTVDETWWNFNNAFGGWAIATALAAVKQHDEVRGELLTVNAVFPAAIKAGQVEFLTERIARRSQSDFWRVTMTNAHAPDEVLLAVDLVMGRRRKTDGDTYSASFPKAPDPETIEILNMQGAGPAWLQHYEQRLFEGVPFTINEQPKTMAWISHKDERPIDTKALLAISDTPMPRVFFSSKELRFGSTIAFSATPVYSEKDLAELAPTRALIEANAKSVGDGIYDQGVSIWSECGTLLAISNQTAVYR